MGKQGSCGQNDHPHRPFPPSGPQPVLPLTKRPEGKRGRNVGCKGQPAGRPRPEMGHGQRRAVGTPVITLPANVWAQTGLPTLAAPALPVPPPPSPVPPPSSSSPPGVRPLLSPLTALAPSGHSHAVLSSAAEVFSTGTSLTSSPPAKAARNSPFWLLRREAAGGGQGLWITVARGSASSCAPCRQSSLQRAALLLSSP